jgi:hypothetical protein
LTVPVRSRFASSTSTSEAIRLVAKGLPGGEHRLACARRPAESSAGTYPSGGVIVAVNCASDAPLLPSWCVIQEFCNKTKPLSIKRFFGAKLWCKSLHEYGPFTRGA